MLRDARLTGCVIHARIGSASTQRSPVNVESALSLTWPIGPAQSQLVFSLFSAHFQLVFSLFSAHSQLAFSAHPVCSQFIPLLSRRPLPLI